MAKLMYIVTKNHQTSLYTIN